MGRAGMGPWVGNLDGGTGRVLQGVRVCNIECITGHLPGTYQMSPGETCLLSLRIPRPLHIPGSKQERLVVVRAHPGYIPGCHIDHAEDLTDVTNRQHFG